MKLYCYCITLALHYAVQVVTSTDAIMKNGVTQNVSTRNQCITVMNQYEGKSIEVKLLSAFQR